MPRTNSVSENSLKKSSKRVEDVYTICQQYSVIKEGQAVELDLGLSPRSTIYSPGDNGSFLTSISLSVK